MFQTHGVFNSATRISKESIRKVVEKAGLTKPTNKRRHTFPGTTTRTLSQNNSENQAKWLHHGKEVKDTFIAFNAKFLGSMDVSQPKGVDMVKDSIKKLKIQRQLKKADAGHKASKLVKVEIIISIDAIKVVEQKNKNMICARPLQRVSYCADDHRDKRLFAFIAKEQDTKCHKCFVFVSEKEASEITLTLGQAFQLAYKRYLEKEKTAKKEAATENAANMEKENEKLKQENERLKEVLESKSKDESAAHLANGEIASDDNSPYVEVPNSPMTSTLPTASFGFLPPSPQQPTSGIADMNDIFLSGFNQPTGDTFDPRQTNHNPNHNPAVNHNLFATTPTTPPRVDDFVVKQDPFADTPDWSRTASVCSADLSRSQSVTGQYGNGIDPLVNGTNHMNLNNSGHCNRNNPFLSGDKTNSTKSLNDPSSDLFSQYLSNVVAQRDPDNGPSNGTCTPNNESYLSHSNGSSSRSNSLDHFNISNISEFSVNNEFDFDKMNMADSSCAGKTINDFSEADDAFFTDDNFIPRPKAHTITVLTTEEQKFHDMTPPVPQVNGGGRYSMGGEGNQHINNTANNTTNGFNEDDYNETFERPKAKSVGSSYNQAVRPRPTSLAVQSQVLPAPPSKSSIKKPATLLIKTPPQKMTTSTPLKEEPTGEEFDRVEERRTKPRSQSYILPNVRATGPILPETRARSRSRHVPLQTQPLKESISRASKSLEDLCSLESPGSNKSISPKSTPGSRVPPAFPNPFTPTATTPQF